MKRKSNSISIYVIPNIKDCFTLYLYIEVDGMADLGNDITPLEGVRRLVMDIALRLGAPSAYLPTFGHSDDGAKPHIEVDQAYHWVVVERGGERERKTTMDLDELLYWIFSDVTRAMASDFELKNRVAAVSSRRLLFRKQLELMRLANNHWEERRSEEIERILSKYPFNDGGKSTLY